MTMAEKIKRSPMFWLRKVTVEPVLFLYMFSLYLLFGVFQNLVYNSVCRELIQWNKKLLEKWLDI